MRATTNRRSVLLLTAVLLTALLPGAALVDSGSTPANAAPTGDDGTHDEHDGTDSSDATVVCASARPSATSFSDLVSSSTHAGAVECMVSHGIISGREDGTFGADSALTRGQMASLLARFLHVAAPGTQTSASRSDGPSLADLGDSVHRQGIELLLDLGITTGHGDGTFGPLETVTREQLASFLYRTHRSIGMTFASGHHWAFEDVIPGSVHAESIAALTGQGILHGLTTTSYGPRQAVTRGQAATLLARSAQLLHGAGLWEGETHEVAEVPAGAAGELPEGGTVGGGGDLVVTGHTIVEGEVDARTVTVTSSGTLEFAPEASTSLTVTGNVVVEGTLEMQPAGPTVNHAIQFVGIDEADFVGGGHHVLASDTGLWFTGHGRAVIDGTERLAWTRADASLRQGERTISLEDNPDGWQVGDELTITPTNTPGSAGHSTGYSSGRITGISGRTVTLDTPLSYDHPRVNGRWGAEVMNMTRNVRIEGTPQGRAHVLFLHTQGKQHLRNLELRHLGPRQETGDTYGSSSNRLPITAGVLGRYPLHFHHNAAGSAGTLVENVVVRESGHKAFVAHASHGITFRGTVAHDVMDTPYWWDRRTGCCGSHAVWEPPSNDISYERAIASLVKTDPPFRGYRLAGFELGHGNNLSVTDSVAVGVQGNKHAAGFNWPEGLARESGDPTIGDHWTFTNNVAHNNKVNGIFTWQNGGNPNHLIGSSALFHNGEHGVVHGAYSNRYHYDALELYGNGRAGFDLHAQGQIPLTNLIFDGAGISQYGLVTSRHRNEATGVTLRSPTFTGYTDRAIALLSPDREHLDIIDPTFDGPESTWFRLGSDVPTDSVIRVQLSDGTTFQLHPASSSKGTPVPAWNARRETIAPFA